MKTRGQEIDVLKALASQTPNRMARARQERFAYYADLPFGQWCLAKPFFMRNKPLRKQLKRFS